MKLPWPDRFLGYGPNIDDSLSALWEPITNRFILISHRTDVLLDLSKWTPRKFMTVVINLDRSVSSNNLLDNDVCLNWTIADSSHIQLSDHTWNPVPSGQILEVGPYQEWNLGQEQTFFMAAHRLLESVCIAGRFNSAVTGGMSEDWLHTYDVVNTVMDDSVFLLPNVELHRTIHQSALRSIFDCHTHQELDHRWFEVLDKHALVDDWIAWVKKWDKK